MRDPKSDAELLDDRVTVLAPAGTADSPWGSIGRRGPVLAIVLVGVVAVWLVVLGSGPHGVISAIPSTSGSGEAAIGPTIGPSGATASGVASSCGRGIQIAPPTAPVAPEAIGGIRAPAGGLLATALESSPSDGTIVVSRSAPEGGTTSRVVATISGRRSPDPFGVTVVGWSAAGDAILVRAAEDGSRSADHNCTILALVQADGSGVTSLTPDPGGPGDWLPAVALAPTSERIAYVRDNELWLTDTATPSERVDMATCPGVGTLQWSPDEERLLAECDGVELVLDLGIRTPQSLPIDPNGVPVSAAWSPDSGSIRMVTAGRRPDGSQFGPLIVDDVDPSSGAATHRVETEKWTEWGSPSRFISPNGRWLIAEGLVLGHDYFTFYAGDLTTGATTELPWPLFSGVVGQESFGWLADGESLLYADSGTLYAVNLRDATRTEAGSIPATAFAWLNEVAPAP